SLDRRDASIELVGRFPEREEYIISTSEFQRVKAHLMKLTNARAGVVSDLEEEDVRPILQRRQPAPEGVDPADPDVVSSSSDSGPPQLKRRGEPDPKPSPQP